jgi:hypothetical protein
MKGAGKGRPRVINFRESVMRSSCVVHTFALLVAVAGVVQAQSLGDIAKKEEARRKTVKGTAKVYTNDDLHSDGSAPPPAAAPAQPAPAPSATAQQPAPPSAAADDSKKDEKYWKDRMVKAREAVERAKTFADALQSRINALTADFSARSDPAQRAVIGDDRNKALAELDRVKKEIDDNTKEIAKIQEEARRANVPAGWVR